MAGKKDVKVLFHTLTQVMYLKSGEKEKQVNPFYDIDKIIKFIMKSKKVDKFKDLKDNKFCFLESSDTVVKNNDVKFISLLFKSARNEFRPNIINKKTGEEKKNPKQLLEGDIEKTHMVIKIDMISEEVCLFVESNYYGATVNNIINYFREFNKRYIASKELKMNYYISDQMILRNDFLTELERLTKSKIAEVHFNKKLLGSGALDFSNKTIALKKELKLVATATKGESLTDTVLDFYTKLKAVNSEIYKVRVIGADSEDNEVVLDTEKMGKKEFIEVDLNPETGEVNTTQLFTGLKKIAKSF